MHARKARDPAEDCVVRMGDAPQQVGDGHHDREQHSVEDVHDQDRAERRQREDEFAAAEPGDAFELLDVDQSRRRVDDERAERGRREVRQQRSTRKQDEYERGEDDERVQLSATARRVAECGSATAAADRESLDQAGPDVGHAQRE